MIPELNKTYKMTFPKSGMVAKLVKIETYPAAGMPNDYIFEFVSGDDCLCGHSPIHPKNCFPLPQALLYQIKFEEVGKDGGIEEVLSSNYRPFSSNEKEIEQCKGLLAAIKVLKGKKENSGQIKTLELQETEIQKLLHSFTYGKEGIPENE